MWLCALGAVIVIWVSMEMIATITMTGGGLASMILPWVVSRIFQDKQGRFRLRPWPALGVTMIVSTVVLWLILLWSGWAMIFNCQPNAVVHTGSGEPASFWSRVYFSGYTLSTLGIGDFSPGNDLWRVLTAAASLSGFFLLTLTISFFVPMVQGEMRRRRTALLIHHLGATPHQIISRCYHPDRAEVMPALNMLLPELVALEQVHRRYPVLHYSGSRARRYSLVLAVATLDEALTLVMSCDDMVHDEHVGAARRAIEGLLATMDAIFIRISDEVPPAPDTAAFARTTLDFPGQEYFEAYVGHLDGRRRQLSTLVEAGGWSWEDVELVENDPSPVRFFFLRH